jgi:hypothetical protein
MRFEKHNGNWQVCGYIFPNSEIKVGQRWQGGSGKIVTIEKNEKDKIYYSWMEKGAKVFHDKSTFAFQCRYFLILDNPLESVICYFSDTEILKNPNECQIFGYREWTFRMHGPDKIVDGYVYVDKKETGVDLLKILNTRAPNHHKYESLENQEILTSMIGE